MCMSLRARNYQIVLVAYAYISRPTCNFERIVGLGTSFFEPGTPRIALARSPAYSAARYGSCVVGTEHSSSGFVCKREGRRISGSPPVTSTW